MILEQKELNLLFGKLLITLEKVEDGYELSSLVSTLSNVLPIKDFEPIKFKTLGEALDYYDSCEIAIVIHGYVSANRLDYTEAQLLEIFTQSKETEEIEVKDVKEVIFSFVENAYYTPITRDYKLTELETEDDTIFICYSLPRIG